MSAAPDGDALRRCLRDVLGLLALPARWRGGDDASILESLLEAVEGVLPVELAYAAARAQPAGRDLARLRWRGGYHDATAPSWRGALQRCGVAEPTPATGSLALDHDVLGFTRLPIGDHAEYGVLLVAGVRAGFPGPEEAAFLRAAVTLAATGLHTARIMREREAAVRVKDELLAMLGHELRNPVAAISAAATLLGRANLDPSIGQRAHQVLQRQTAQLARVLDDLLDVSRAASGQISLDLRPVELAEIVDRAVAVAQASGPADHRIVVVATPTTVHGDTARIEQIVMSLLTNAMRSTPGGATIGLDVHAEGAWGVVRITDPGVGIAPDLLPRIFDVFVRGEPSTGQRAPGLGIGLALVRKLVDLHGGTLEAHSDGPGRGSTFTVRLPRAAAAEPLPAAPTPAPASGRRVLVIEDHDDNREMLGTMLSLGGHTVESTASGAAGVRLAVAIRPDVALIDIGLPDIDGYEVARRIRAGCGSRVRLVALTGFGQPEDRERAVAAGFDAHIVKPVMPDLLASVIATSAPPGTPAG